MYPPVFAAAATPEGMLIQNTSSPALQLYYMCNGMNTGEYTSMYAASKAIYKLAEDGLDRGMFRKWTEFRQNPCTETAEALLAEYIYPLY
jgi:hypothetical protein